MECESGEEMLNASEEDDDDEDDDEDSSEGKREVKGLGCYWY